MTGFQNWLIYLFIKAVLEIFAFKVKKRGDFFLVDSPLMKCQKVGTKSLISEFSKLLFK